MSALVHPLIFYVRKDLISRTAEADAEPCTKLENSRECGIEILDLVRQSGLGIYYRLQNATPAASESTVFHRPDGETLTVPAKVTKVAFDDKEVLVILPFFQALKLLFCYVSNISCSSQDHLFTLTRESFIAPLCVLPLPLEDSKSNVGLPCANSPGCKDGANRPDCLNPRGSISFFCPRSDCRPAWVDGKCDPEEEKYKRKRAHGCRNCELGIAVIVGSHVQENRRVVVSGNCFSRSAEYEPR